MVVFSQKELEYLKEQWLGRLATVSKEQIPHVTPVAFATDGERVYLNILPDTKKIRNIRENPRVSFVVDDYLSWEKIRAVLINWKAELITSGKLHQIARDLFYKKYPKYEKDYSIEEEGSNKYILVITPTKVISWGL